MSVATEEAAEAAIGAACRALHLPTVRSEAARLAEIAARERLTHRGYLAEVLVAEVDERDSRRRARRVVEARFPRIKRLADFDCATSGAVTPATLASLAAGSFIDAGDPLCLIGDSGTGKSHLLIGTGVAACEGGRRVRYVTCAGLVNELAEAADDRVLSRVVARYGRLDLLCLDEVGYVHLDPKGAELVNAASPELEAEPTSKDDAAFWLYSSGSTGFPKGCVHLHRDMVVCTDLYARGVLDITERDRCFSRLVATRSRSRLAKSPDPKGA